MGAAKKGSRMMCHHMGDYPLILQDENGGVHCRIIKNVLVSNDTSHNLISLADLHDVNVGFETPPDRTMPTNLSIRTPCGNVTKFRITPINRLYPIPRWNLDEYPLSELNSSSVHGFAGVSVEQRVLTRSELWHH